MARAAVSFVLFVASAFGAASARAQDEPRQPPAEAVQFYESGAEHYRAGRYQEAIVDLERALALDPQSRTLAYNLARVYELTGDLERAIDYYQQYLVFVIEDGDAEERERIEGTVERLQGALDQQPDEPPPPVDAPPPPPVETRRGVADVPVFVSAAAAGALIVTGAVAGGLALRRHGQYEDFVLGPSGTADERQSFRDQAERLALVSDVLIVAGALTGTAALLLYALRTETVEGPARASVSVTPDGATLTVRGGF